MTIRGAAPSPHDRYLRLFRMLKERDASIAAAFDDLRRSTAIQRLAAMIALGVVTDEEKVLRPIDCSMTTPSGSSTTDSCPPGRLTKKTSFLPAPLLEVLPRASGASLLSTIATSRGLPANALRSDTARSNCTRSPRRQFVVRALHTGGTVFRSGHARPFRDERPSL